MYMYAILEYTLLILIILALYFEPYVLSEFSQSNIGKVIFLIFIIMLTSKNSLVGFLGALLFIVLLENSSYKKEGFNDISSATDEQRKTAAAINMLCIPSPDSGATNSASNLDSMSCISLDGTTCASPSEYDQITGIHWDNANKEKCDICDFRCTDWTVTNQCLMPNKCIPDAPVDRLTSESNLLYNQ